MTSNWRLLTAIGRAVVLGSVLAALVLPAALAQEETAAGDPPPQDIGLPGELVAHLELWVAQPVGLDYSPATRNPAADPLGTEIVSTRHGTEREGRFRLGYGLPNDGGEFVMTWYSHVDEAKLFESTPGQFQFGETLAHPFHAGINDDGLADAYRATVETKLREFRLDFYRHAFAGERASGRWFVGVRRLFLFRDQEATYFGLLPGLPAVLPPVSAPRPDLRPAPDLAVMESKYNGRGAEAGLEVQFPLWKDKIILESGVAGGALRGTLDTEYASITNLYAVVDITAGTVDVLSPPYSEFEQPDPGGGFLIDKIQQLTVPVGLKAERVSTNSLFLETHLGVRSRVWRGMEVFGGFRIVRYDKVGLDQRPRDVTVNANGVIQLESVEQTFRSAGYEGFYLGVSYRY